MNIAEAERRTGLTRANIRFYEKEGLLTPTRGENGYRDYTEDNVQTLRKIMLVRRLRLSVPDIRAIESGEKALPEAAAGQLDVLQGDIRESEQAYAMCRAICEDRAEWNGLDVDRYQSIVLPADDPREKDRIPPAGCPLPCPQCGCRTVWAAVVDAVAVGVPHQSGEFYPDHGESGVVGRVRLCRLAADVRVRAGAAALLGHNARQVDLRAVRPR